jgi:hypothetical protein
MCGLFDQWYGIGLSRQLTRRAGNAAEDLAMDIFLQFLLTSRASAISANLSKVLV